MNQETRLSLIKYIEERKILLGEKLNSTCSNNYSIWLEGRLFALKQLSIHWNLGIEF